MRFLLDDRWVSGLPDTFRLPGECAVEVLTLHNLERLEGLYFIRPRDPRMVWNYAREIGVRATLRKVLSRTRERFRNEKYLSCGFGRIVVRAENGSLKTGQRVVFIAPIGPACAERLMLPEALLLPIESRSIPVPEDWTTILYRGVAEQDETGCWWHALRGFSPYSGEVLPDLAAGVALKDALEFLRRVDWSSARRLPSRLEQTRFAVNDTAPEREDRRRRRRQRGVLFGYGNYAKTAVLPAIGKHVQVDRIHEIDPSQIPLSQRGKIVWNTSPTADAQDLAADCFVITGYHHTHAPLACAALQQGLAAVVEKPLATDRSQLRDLVTTLNTTGGRFFGGFQRRYLPFNELARRDLGVGPSDPINYHCIVYEVPLPEHHWYRWPNSRGRMVSNGCHWIDHFLYLNGWCDFEGYQVSAARDGSLSCSVSLENGAFFTMVLSHQGSERLGAQDHVELRAGGVTVKILNTSRYEAEDRSRVLRRARINRLEPNRLMYDSIGRRIAAGEPGDSARSVELSAGLTLELAEQLTLVREARVRALEPLARLQLDEVRAAA
jgi:predicted dehydrogenase